LSDFDDKLSDARLSARTESVAGRLSEGDVSCAQSLLWGASNKANSSNKPSIVNKLLNILSNNFTKLALFL